MSYRLHRVLVVLALTLAGFALGIMPAEAQYFGRNKVQYRDFDFKVVSTPHFDIYYYPEQEEFVGHVARMAERWYSRLKKIFNGDLSSRQPLILYASSADFRQTNALSGEIGEGTGGVTEGLRRRIIMPSAGSLAETDHVLGHELVHAFQYRHERPLGRRPRVAYACRSGWSKASPRTRRSGAWTRRRPCGSGTRW